MCPYTLNCVLSVASLSIALLHYYFTDYYFTALVLVTPACPPLWLCFEWKAGPPSSPPFSAFSSASRSCSEQKRFQYLTVELPEPRAAVATVVPPDEAGRGQNASCLSIFRLARHPSEITFTTKQPIAAESDKYRHTQITNCVIRHFGTGPNSGALRPLLRRLSQPTEAGRVIWHVGLTMRVAYISVPSVVVISGLRSGYRAAGSRLRHALLTRIMTH